MKAFLVPIIRGMAMAMMCASFAGYSYAEVLPWLAGAEDPYHLDAKADAMIERNLKPDTCPTAPDISHKLKFNEVVMGVMCNSQDARVAYIGLLNQAEGLASNYAEYLPTIAAGMSQSRAASFAKGSHSKSISRGSDLSSSLTLYDFGQREFKLEAAELTLAAAGNSYNANLQGMISSALTGYYSLLTAQNGVKIAEESENFSKESFDAADLRYQIGQTPLIDKLQAQASYSSAKLATEQARNTLMQSRSALALLMGLPADSAIEVEELDNDVLAKDPFGGTIKALMERAKRINPELLASRKQLRAAEIGLKATERSNFATISASASMGRSSGESWYFSRSSSHSQSLGVSVSIPLFSGFSQSYSMRSARQQLEAQRLNLEKTELTVEQSVWNAWHSYEIAKQSWDTSKEQFSNAVMLKDIALGRYKEGLGTLLDVLNAELQYSTALQSQLSTRYSLLTARLDLVRTVGLLDLKTMYPDSAVDNGVQRPEPLETNLVE